MPGLFTEARLKVDRAIEHINDLNGILESFAKNYTHNVFIEHDANGGDDLLKVSQSNLPESFPFVLGDALHNLRTALDYAMNEIEFLTTGARTKYTKFPVADTRNALIAATNGGLKQKAPKQVLECIEDVIQPYNGGDGHILWALHDLDIEDKHRLLIVKSELNLIRGITIEDDAGFERAVGDWLVVDNVIASHPLRGMRKAKVKNKGNAVLNILFGDTPPLPRARLFPAVHQMTANVINGLDELQRAYLLSQVHLI